MEPIDLVIHSNGPGELATWVRPVVNQIQDCHPTWRISVILSPCTNASGNEVAVARAMPGVARVLGPEDYQGFWLLGKTPDSWDWYRRGVVLFLGGDQGLTAFIGWRLKYPVVVYAEWQSLYPQFMARVGLRNPQVHPKYTANPEKFRIVGDLNIDGVRVQQQEQEHLIQTLDLATHPLLIGFLPGSKGLKLTLGMPLILKTAELLQGQYPHAQFVLPVAPTLNLDKLLPYATHENPNIALMGGVTAQLEYRESEPYLVTTGGVAIRLWAKSPAYDILSLCRVCVTMVGVNTAELAALGIPMVVVIPLNKVELMKAWDGLLGLVMGIPGLGDILARYINPWLISRTGLLAWPNRLAGAEIVPELKKVLTSEEVFTATIPFIEDDELHTQTGARLQAVMGGRGAAEKLVTLVEEVLLEKSGSD
jgi:hypothetical protein